MLNCIEARYDEIVRIKVSDDADEIFVAGCGQPTFPGSIVDGTIVSDAIARFALNTLSPGYPPPPGDVVSIAIRDAEQAGAIETTWHTLVPSSDCPLCTRS